MLKMTYKTKSYLKAFSILETLVSITTIGVILLMLNNVILDFVIISQKSLARSTVREEIATATTRMVTDIRNADTLGACSGASCQVFSATGSTTWQLCGTSICKLNNVGAVVYTTSPILQVTSFNIAQGPVTNNNISQNNVLITIVGKHQNDNLNINNILRQVSVSTRNYSL